MMNRLIQMNKNNLALFFDSEAPFSDAYVEEFSNACQTLQGTVGCIVFDLSSDNAQQLAAQILNLDIPKHSSDDDDDALNERESPVVIRSQVQLLNENGRVIEQFSCGTTAKSIIFYTKRFFAPDVFQVGPLLRVESLLETELPIVIGFFPSALPIHQSNSMEEKKAQIDSEEYQQWFVRWRQIASVLKQRLSFAEVFDPTLLPQAKSKPTEPVIVLYTDHWHPRRLSFSKLSSMSTNEIVDWLDRYRQAHVQVTTQETIQQDIEIGFPIVWLWVEKFATSQESYLDFFNVLSNEFADRLTFRVINLDKMVASTNGDFTQALMWGCEPLHMPSVSIVDFRHRNPPFYSFPSASLSLDEQQLRTWIQHFLSGKLPPTIRSEVYKQQEEDTSSNLVTLTYNTFSHYVRQSQPVVVGFWNSITHPGHAKQDAEKRYKMELLSDLANVFEKFEGPTKLIVASYDISKNHFKPNEHPFRPLTLVDPFLYMGVEDEAKNIVYFPEEWHTMEFHELWTWILFRLQNAGYNLTKNEMFEKKKLQLDEGQEIFS